MGERIVKPYLYVEIDNQNVSAYITPHLISFAYTDNDGLEKDATDDVEIVVADSTGFFRENPPLRGSSLKVKFGYDSKVKDAGIFHIDSYQYAIGRGGDTFTIKAMAKDVKASFRTVKTVGFENTSLKSIAAKIASEQGYILDFAGDDVVYKRITQQEKRDLEFLSGLCKQYGFTCKTANQKLIIRSLTERLASETLYVLNRAAVFSCSIDVSSIYAADVDVKYLDPVENKTHSSNEQTAVKSSGDTEKLNVRVENKGQADKISEAKKTLLEMKEMNGSLTCVGLPDIHASGAFELSGFGRYDRQYYISQAVHNISRGGYTTSMSFLVNPKVSS